MSQFSWFVSNYRLMNNRPKVFTRTWNSMNRFFRCLPFIDSHINDHCGINQNAAGWLFYFLWWKEISLSQKVESADFWERFLLRRNLRWIFAERKLFFTWFFDDIDKMMMRLSLMKMTHTSFAYSLFSFNILVHLLVVAKLSKFSENQKIDLQ